MTSVLTQIKAMTDSLTQRTEEPDDEIVINGDDKDNVEVNLCDSDLSLKSSQIRSLENS